MEDGDQVPQRLHSAGHQLVADFVAGAPDHHGRMIAVTPHEIGHVAFMPLVEILRIAVGSDLALGHAPFVESLVHHQEPKPVAEVEEFGRRWIVAGANGVASHLFEQLQAALPDAFGNGRAHRAAIVVQARAVQLHVLPVQQETAIRIEHRLAHAEWRLILVDDLLSEPHGAAQRI